MFSGNLRHLLRALSKVENTIRVGFIPNGVQARKDLREIDEAITNLMALINNFLDNHYQKRATMNPNYKHLMTTLAESEPDKTFMTYEELEVGDEIITFSPNNRPICTPITAIHRENGRTSVELADGDSYSSSDKAMIGVHPKEG